VEATLFLIEVATNSIQHILAHFIERVGFCKNRFANGTADVTALRGFFNHEMSSFMVASSGWHHATQP
jgi:hypothetical protein